MDWLTRLAMTENADFLKKILGFVVGFPLFLKVPRGSICPFFLSCSAWDFGLKMGLCKPVRGDKTGVSIAQARRSNPHF